MDKARLFRNKTVIHLVGGAALFAAAYLYDRSLWQRIVLYVNARLAGVSDDKTRA